MCLEASVFKKGRKSQPIPKVNDKNITQETSLGWKEALPIALLCTHIVPKQQVGLSPYEMLYGILRESFPRQVDRESRGPQGERGLEFSRRKKG